MNAAAGRSYDALAAEVDGLHALVATLTGVIVGIYVAQGVPVPPGLPDPAAGQRQAVQSARPQRHLSLAVSR